MARKKQKQKRNESALLPTGRASPAKRASPAHFYRSIGDKGWNNSNYFTYSSSSPAFRRWLVGELGVKARDILSVGCGNGELESYLIGEGHRLTGLDPAHPMLRRAVRNGLTRPVGGDARALPFAVASFDVVIFPESIGHVPLPEVFAEASRVLKKSGALIVTTYASHVGVHAHYRKYRFADLAAAAAGAGLAVEARRFLAAKRYSVADAPNDSKATLLYFRAGARAAQPAAAKPPSARLRRA